MTIKIELEFIPVSERLPEESGNYLCVTKGGHFNEYEYSKKYEAFNVCDHFDDCSSAIDVIHWAKLPDLSKAKEKAPADYLWAINHWRTPLNEKQEERLQEIVNGHANESINTEQRRRDLFERVAVAIAGNAYNTMTSDDELCAVAAKLANKIIEQSDKFARGE